MYDGYFETPAQIQARFDRINANMEQIRIRDEMIAEVAPMLELLQSAVAGTLIVDAQRWQDEAIAQEADAKDWQDQVTDLRAGG